MCYPQVVRGKKCNYFFLPTQTKVTAKHIPMLKPNRSPTTMLCIATPKQAPTPIPTHKPLMIFKILSFVIFSPFLKLITIATMASCSVQYDVLFLSVLLSRILPNTGDEIQIDNLQFACFLLYDHTAVINFFYQPLYAAVI